MMNKLLMIIALIMPLAAIADDKDNTEYKLGDEVRAWTKLQESGAASNPKPQPMPGEIADKVYDRYLKAFDQAIPESFTRDSFVSGGGGSGGQ